MPGQDGTCPRLPMERTLQGRVALITGSSGGIGLGIARALAARGAGLMLNGRRPAAEMADLCQALEALAAAPVHYLAADVGHPQASQRMTNMALEIFGRIDILVNNAGVQHVAPVGEFPIERWDDIIATNLTAAFLATRAVLPGMTARGWGRIVNIASAHALVGSPFKSAYVAAKHGLLGLTRVVALEAAEAGVTCNAVCPGYVRTPLVERQVAAQARAHGVAEDVVIRDVLLAQQPNRRFAGIEEVAGLVAFLCSEEAAGITGAALAMDGGWTAR
ncbi:3-hydroxybutyrate dehydrogenase [Paracraurococcus lichenis]|uniref:3-hydroxybutyrate dehydrogenase n=1 Tax=Paracraurococcus lichenis TaxID=3064888 RepID=A0ABT9E6V4_9PROT|nr:3-hydroxybutyrate dehydrogenase [Paracraurococcus sp. LOR1-02]MDO9711922.1 3-hydroxybutyrate dehydrogenase [Paracraurococcus sp. LOR1-02]